MDTDRALAVQLWDRRSSLRTPVGVFVGHMEGITHIDPKVRAWHPGVSGSGT